MSGRTEVYDEIVRISEKLEKTRQELVPTMGKADTLEGETLRAFDRVVYRWFNDGDRYTDLQAPRAMDWEDDEEEAAWYAETFGDGYITVRPSVVWLSVHGVTSEIRAAAERIQLWDHLGETYDELLLGLANAIEHVEWDKRTPYNGESSR